LGFATYHLQTVIAAMIFRAMSKAKEPSHTTSAKQSGLDGRHRDAHSRILGRSPLTGRLVLQPASKGGSVSIQAVKAAVKNALNGHQS
jgi:hypothetical protein